MALAFFTLLGTGSWLTAWFVGSEVVLAALVVAGHLISTRPAPGRRDQLALWAVLVVALAGGGMVVVGLGAAVLCALFLRSVRRWWPALAGAGVLYVAWFVVERSDIPTAAGPADIIPGLAWTAELFRDAAAHLFGLPSAVGWPLLAALVAGIVLLGRARRLDAYAGLLLLTALVFAGMVAIVRIGPGIMDVGEGRYAYTICMLVLVALAPLVPVPSSRGAAAAAAAAALVALGVNAYLLHDGLANLAARARESRRLVESAAALVEAGEPVSDGTRMEGREGYMTREDLEALLHGGWDPAVSEIPAVEMQARGLLRMAVRGSFPRFGEAAPGVTSPAAGRDGCTRVGAEGLVATVRDAGTLRLDPVAGTAAMVTAEWEDECGVGRITLPVSRRVFLRLAEPQTTAALRFEGNATFRVCGLDGGQASPPTGG